MNTKKLLIAPLVLSFFIGVFSLIRQTEREGSCFGPFCGSPVSTNNGGTPHDPMDDTVACLAYDCTAKDATTDKCSPSWIKNSETWECSCKDINDPRPLPHPKPKAELPALLD